MMKIMCYCDCCIECMHELGAMLKVLMHHSIYSSTKPYFYAITTFFYIELNIATTSISYKRKQRGGFSSRWVSRRVPYLQLHMEQFLKGENTSWATPTHWTYEKRTSKQVGKALQHLTINSTLAQWPTGFSLRSKGFEQHIWHPNF